MKNRTYIAIDLKSFYASVECVERGLDPFKANLVVADPGRTEKTICLAVSPALKKHGVPGRPRLFEVIQRVNEINEDRKKCAPAGKLSGSTTDNDELEQNKELALDFITAPPQMAHYMEFSTKIYDIYLKYVAHEDMHVYSVDEVFLDVTNYLKAYKLTARELTMKIILDVLSQTGITATAGIGTNMYLCKIAMDIEAKHISADKNGVRIAELDEMMYRKKLWSHRPLTDFWRVGNGIAKKLEQYGLYTMGDVAMCSLGKPDDYYNEDLLYKLFGINAELLIDHAWGWEPCTIAEIKNYKPQSNSLGSGQVLQFPYPFEKALLVTTEMADMLSLDLVDKRLVTNQIVITVGYDIDNLTNKEISDKYKGEISTDRYGRKIPQNAHGTINLDNYTSSSSIIINAASELFTRIVNKDLLVRRIFITAARVIREKDIPEEHIAEQLDFFSDPDEDDKKREAEAAALKKERTIQEAMLNIKKRFGKNAILKGTNLEEGATAKERNSQIGGHKA